MCSICVNLAPVAHATNCFWKIVSSLSRVDSARFSLRLLVRNRVTALLTVTFSESESVDSYPPFCFA